jgi:hypothetical protein
VGSAPSAPWRAAQRHEPRRRGPRSHHGPRRGHRPARPDDHRALRRRPRRPPWDPGEGLSGRLSRRRPVWRIYPRGREHPRRRVVAARVSRRGVGETAWDLGREKVTTAQPGPLSLSLRATMAKGRTLLPRTRRRMASRHGHPHHSREEESEMRKDDFTPGGHAKPLGQPPRVTVWFYDHRQPTYTQSLTFGSREKQAHKSVTGRVRHEGRWRAK